MHEIHLQGGLLAGKVSFAVMETNDFEFLAYISQKEEFWDWIDFWAKFSA